MHTVVVTHSHPDHFGGAGFLRRESGAEIVTHRWFRTWFDPAEPPDVDPAELPPMEAPIGRQPWGGEGFQMPWKRRLGLKASRWFPKLMGTPQPSVRLTDAEPIRLARREWVAVHTPGHTADHLCLYDPTEGTMLSGDHVLPSITPHISGLTGVDPLLEFFNSLDKVAAFADTRTVLPAHGHPFPDLQGRVADIKRHHVERLDLLRTTSADLGRPATVMEMSTHLFSPGPRGRWRTARRTPTSSTCAMPARRTVSSATAASSTSSTTDPDDGQRSPGQDRSALSRAVVVAYNVGCRRERVTPHGSHRSP